MTLAIPESTVMICRPLNVIADEIREQAAKYRGAEVSAFEAQLATGRLLLEARRALPSDQAFGDWFRTQQFGFKQARGYVLRRAAEHEAEVVEAVTSQLMTGNRPNIEKAVAKVCPPSQKRQTARSPTTRIRESADPR